MAEILGDSAYRSVPVADWELILSDAGRWTRPGEVAGEWIPAGVPGTAAAALEAAGLWHRDRAEPLHDKDVWYRARLPATGGGVLRLGGLATMAEVWLDGEHVLSSDSMFVARAIALPAGPERSLHIAFRSLAAELARRKGKRARWRTQMIPDARLRFVRTTLLGHMPGWCPPIDCVGPWGGVEFVEAGAEPRWRADLQATLDGDVGRLTVRLISAGGVVDLPPEHCGDLLCAGGRVSLRREGRDLVGELALPGVAKWWPHTHGEPALHRVVVRIGERTLDLGRVGFRRIDLDRGPDGSGFAIRVNDVPVFCRGAVWMPPDIVDPGLSGAELNRSLALVREAGLNMLRVSGTTAYQPQRFHDRCDELGILVWQDLMFANFDYPAADDAFAASVRGEVSQLLDRLQASPSLAILCGGSEVAQQAAMTGLPPGTWSNRFIDETVPGCIEMHRAGTIFVPSSPYGGDLPFAADSGCTHYYGVGAYRRPLEDARRANVRFASECLAFANVPEAASPAMPSVPALHHPAWKEGVPRDLGASWDFEDVREHYLALLYGVDPPRLRSEDPERYLQLSRAVVADVIAATFAEWRRPGSPTGGALLWTWQDLRRGAGWGVVDAAGRPKSAWFALARASRSVGLFITDEGVNGLHLHAVNDTAMPIEASLTFTCFRAGRMAVASGQRDVTVPAQGGQTVTSAAMLGRFFDVNYAYRFGPPDHEVCDAVLATSDGAIVAEAQWWLPGRRTERHHLGLAAILERDEIGWSLRVSTERMAAGVVVEDDAYRSDDSYFDLAPGRDRVVRLISLRDKALPPSGRVRALNALDAVAYDGKSAARDS